MREELNTLHTERQLERNHEVYRQAALMHEMQHPGYVQEIYKPYQQSVRTGIAAANPGFTAEQVELAARQDEDALFRSALRQGRDPHSIIHAQARLRGIYSTAERNYMTELDRQARAEAQRRQEEVARADYERRRGQIEAQLSNVSWRDLSRGMAGSALDPQGNRVDLLTAAKRWGLAHKFASLLG